MGIYFLTILFLGILPCPEFCLVTLLATTAAMVNGQYHIGSL